MSLQHGLLTKASHAFTIPSMMAFVAHADNITSRMAYVPFVHMNHVLVNALKYLLRDGLEIGMSAGMCSNPQCFSLQYLINLILLLVRGESVTN